MSDKVQRMTSKQYREMMASKGRRRGNPTAGPNKTEQAFMVWISNNLNVERVEYEAIKLRIGNPGDRCWYTPDVLTWQWDQADDRWITVLWDVKARGKDGKPRVEDDALVKIKAAARSYVVIFRFALVWPDGNGGWDKRCF